MQPMFAIGQTVVFGDNPHTVVRYHRVAGHWEVMFRSKNGAHRSVPCTQLETYFGTPKQES